MATVGTGQSGGKRTGDVQFQEYETEEYLAQLDGVMHKLRDVTGEKQDRKTWGLFLAGLMQFQEDTLGRAGVEQKLFPKIPAKLFRNFAPEGSVYSIIHKTIELRDSLGLRKIDFTDTKLRSSNLDLLQALHDTLRRGNFITPPRIRIMPHNGEAVTQLQEIVRQLKGHVVTDEGDTSVTHVVYPNAPGEVDDGDYLRLLHVRSDGVGLVHWWYSPDSYDEWMPVSQISTSDVQHEPTLDRAWKVHSRWLTDSQQYNEWMNPYDYITPEFERELDQLGALDQPGKRKREEGGDGAVDKRVRMLIGEVDPSKAERKTPFVVKQYLVHPTPKLRDGTATLENISQGQQLRVPHIAPRPAKPPRAEGDTPPGIRIPVHSHWFHMEQVSEIERRHLPEFFGGKNSGKTPEMYKELRNFLVAKYREDVKRYLTFSEARKYLSADVSSIYAVWNFLTQWGVINFQAADPPPDSTTATPPETLLDLLASHVQPTKEALLKLPPGSVQAGVQAAMGGGGLPMASSKKDQYHGKDISGKSGQKVRYFCNAMPWVDCTALRYHCTRYPDIDLCPQAYSDGKFPPGCTSKDFIRIEDTDTGGSSNGWSEQEELLLLEGLELHGDTWDAVAQHVGTKSTLECLQHFLTIPIEEDLWQEATAKRGPAAEGQDPPGAGGPLPTSADDPAWDDVIPFADTSNPVMMQVALLQHVVSPKVASAAAQAALEAISEEAAEQPEEAGVGDAGAPDGEKLQQPQEWVSERGVKVAAAKALAAAAVKAKLLAMEEERNMYRLVCNAVVAQLKKVQLKVQHVHQMQDAMERERSRLAVQRQKLTEERRVLLEERERMAAGNPPTAALDAPAANLRMLDDDLDNIFGLDDDDI